MESQPQNPEFKNNPENFHPCIICSSLKPKCLNMAQSLYFWCLNLTVFVHAFGYILMTLQ